jgi:PAS domain S-box-containing protein
LVERGLLNAWENRAPCGFEFLVKLPDDGFRIVCMQGEGADPAPGKAPRLEGTIQDISVIRHVEERLVMLKEAVDSLPIGIAISDVSNRIVYTNPAQAKMHGYSIEALINRDVRDLKGLKLDHAAISENIGNSTVWRRESVNVRESGEEFPVQLSSIAVRNGDEKCLGMVTVCEDITSRKKVEERIRRLAFYDSLTGLPNRTAFLDRL